MILAAFLLIVGMLVLSLPVAAVLALTGYILSENYAFFPMTGAAGELAWNSSNDFILIAAPMFIMMGELMHRSGVSERLFSALAPWFERVPGRLIHTNIASSTLFAAVSGSSVATAATIGTVAIPTMKANRYDDRLTLGSIAAGSTLGILIPPSINMIIYGSMSNTSIGQLFAAGILPGIVLALLFMGYILVVSLLRPDRAGITPPSVPWHQRFRNLLEVLPPLAIFVLIMGSIYLGWATPSESAGVGVVGALLVTIAKRRFSIAMLHEALLSTVKISAMILLIVVAAQFLNFVIGILGIPQTLTRAVGTIASSPFEVLLLLIVFYFILGCFLETLSMMIATIPIVMPLVFHYGIDPVWFGIFLVIMMEVALITPPLGMNLFIVQGVRGEGSIRDVMIGSFPFVLIVLALGLLLIGAPSIALWLPGLVFPS